MDVSPNELRKQTLATMRDIDATIAAVEDTYTSPARATDQHGAYVMPPLLVAKAQCLNTLAILRGQ